MDSDSSLVRVSDAEREAVVTRLNEATSAGRLTLEEFGDRVTAALAARTRGDLDVLVVDLPAASTSLARTSSLASTSSLATTSPYSTEPVSTQVSWSGSGSGPGDIVPIGSVKRTGRWRLEPDTLLGTIVGSVKLDMRQAEFAAPVVTMHVQSVLGSVKVWIPRGVAVEVTGQSLLGSRSVAGDIPAPGAPLLRLKVDTVVGSVKIYRS